jgi:hypothetical protein
VELEQPLAATQKTRLKAVIIRQGVMSMVPLSKQG